MCAAVTFYRALMASLEDEIRDLKVKNNELVQKVQHWKVLAGQRESENLNLMREINDLRLRLSVSLYFEKANRSRFFP